MRDLRDPQALGQLLLEEHELHPQLTAPQVYDQVMVGYAIANYGESEEDFEARLRESFAASRGSFAA